MDIDRESSHRDDQRVSEMQGVFVPNVEEHMKPKIGMIFTSIEEAELLYKNYGKAGCFDVRNRTTTYNKPGLLVAKNFVCSKQGMSQAKAEEVRRCGTGRTCCKAMMRLKLNIQTDKWEVVNFIEEHNHTFTTPSRKHLLKGNREVTTAKKKLIKQFVDVAIPINKQMAFFEHSSGGFDKIGCTEVDVRNYRRDMRAEVMGHDAEMMVDYFKWEKEKNDMFFYKYEVDEEHRLTRCFWADSISILNCEKFGDVIVFDATHNTNQYGLVFVPFVGVNHHGKTVFLGCGLIPNEEANSFIWVFNMWVEAMGRHPVAMVTDQDLGISKAIQRVFPEIRHRYCIWHIRDKLPAKLGAVYYRKEFKDPFLKNMWDAETPSEFEENWNLIWEQNGLETNEWLMDLYQIREKWVPCYLKDTFWAGMSSSQRSESMNFMLKGKVSRKNSLHDFVNIFQRALARQREGELQDDHRSLEIHPTLRTKWPMENQMSRVYMKNIFP